MTIATSDSLIPLPGESDAWLTAKADFGDFVTVEVRFCRENRDFRPRRLTQLAKQRQPCGSRVATQVGVNLKQPLPTEESARDRT